MTSVVFITPFLLYFPYNIREKNIEEYESNLFSEENLKTKLNMLLKLTLPSVINQLDKKNVTGLVLVSKRMPKKYKELLSKLETKYEMIKIILCDDKTKLTDMNISRLINNDLKATVKLNIGEIICKKYTSLVKKYIKNDNCDSVIRFKYGYKVDFKQNKYIPVYGNTIGMAYVSNDDSTVYKVLNREISKKCIVEKYMGSWILVDDTKGAFYDLSKKDLLSKNFHIENK